MDSVWADLNYDHGVTGTPLFKKYHYWGTPFYLGATLVKMKGCLLPKTPRLQVMLDTVRLEWSPPLASFIQQVHKYVTLQINLKKLLIHLSYLEKTLFLFIVAVMITRF